MAKRKALGRGMGALIPQDFHSSPESSTEIFRVPIDQIEPNPYQPRQDFDEETLAELAKSIEVHDVIQPITVRKLEDKKYQLISGERRWRASKMAGLEDIPAYVREADDEQMVEMALIENIQRAELNSIEIALSYQRLMEEFDLTQEEVSDKVGKGRTTITNFLSLLRLPPEIQDALRQEKISMGHAKVLNGVKIKSNQTRLFEEVLGKQLSVRQTEEAARKLNQLSQQTKTSQKKPAEPDSFQIQLNQVSKELEEKFGNKVRLTNSKSGKGEIIIPYASQEDLNRILEILDM